MLLQIIYAFKSLRTSDTYICGSNLGFKWNSNIFIQENALENVVCQMVAILSQPQCVNEIWQWQNDNGRFSLWNAYVAEYHYNNQLTVTEIYINGNTY